MLEPGRRIVSDELSRNGEALPWVNLKKFAGRAVEMARSDLKRMQEFDGIVFFDRGMVDAAVALEFAGGESYRSVLGVTRQYSKTVFLAPPWPEIFKNDAARKHGFREAKGEYLRLETALADMGYDTCELPKVPVLDRVAFVLNKIRAS